MTPSPSPLRETLQRVIFEMRARASEYRTFAGVPCQSESSWHADELERWIAALESALLTDARVRDTALLNEDDAEALRDSVLRSTFNSEREGELLAKIDSLRDARAQSPEGGAGASDPLSPLRARAEHELKTWPEFFCAIECGAKKHEIRKFDRDYHVGDVLVLREYEPGTANYTGRQLRVRVTYMTQAFLPPDLVAMSIELESLRDAGASRAAQPEEAIPAIQELHDAAESIVRAVSPNPACRPETHAESIAIEKARTITVTAAKLRSIFERHRDMRFAWLLEKQIDGQPAYWDGGHAESFTRDANRAVQFARRDDALLACKPQYYAQWGWDYVEHGFMGPSLPERPASPPEGCINCGAIDKGGYMSGQSEDDPDIGAVGPFCAECWEFLRVTFLAAPSPASPPPGPPLPRRTTANRRQAYASAPALRRSENDERSRSA